MSDDSSTGSNSNEGEESDVEVSNNRCIPTQGSMRSYVWEYSKILKNDDPRWLKHNHTHKCILCDFSQVISFVELKSSTAVAFIVEQPKRHLKKYHSDHPVIKAHLGKQATNEEVAPLKRYKNLLGTHFSKRPGCYKLW